MKQPIIAIPTNKGLIFIKQQMVLYCSSEGAYTKIHLLNEQYLMVSKNLKEVTSKLAKELFFRIHHSFLININHVSSFKNNNKNCVLMNKYHTLINSVNFRDKIFSIVFLKKSVHSHRGTGNK